MYLAFFLSSKFSVLVLTFFLSSHLQLEDPAGNRQYYKNSVSSEDYSFTAQRDGKFTYCFSNEAWTSNSKEVSFNVHGIVFVPESELAQEPIEAEGMNMPIHVSVISLGLTLSDF